ncbi:MAG TPA: signal peptidase I [Oscillospiraceae bacterium]|nr:signal peptidase I [Oscillospiraceae bacterium]
MNKKIGIILDWLQVIIIALIIAAVIENFIFSFAIVKGESMLPTLSAEDRLLIIKIPYIYKQLNKGDLIIFNPPNSSEKNEMFIKRIIAKENDHFSIKNGILYINGEIQTENYTSASVYLARNYNYIEGVVPSDMCFVMGDNRNNSNDSRTFGFVPRDRIKAKVLLKVWPLDEIRVFIH